jgi:hypothetical protein
VNRAWLARRAQWLVMALILGFSPVMRPLTSAHAHAYDAPTVAQVDVRLPSGVATHMTQISELRARSTSPAVSDRGRSTTPVHFVVATEAEAALIVRSPTSQMRLGLWESRAQSRWRWATLWRLVSFRLGRVRTTSSRTPQVTTS